MIHVKHKKVPRAFEGEQIIRTAISLTESEVEFLREYGGGIEKHGSLMRGIRRLIKEAKWRFEGRVFAEDRELVKGDKE